MAPSVNVKVCGDCVAHVRCPEKPEHVGYTCMKLQMIGSSCSFMQPACLRVQSASSEVCCGNRTPKQDTTRMAIGER
jgi:hypothetical protein